MRILFRALLDSRVMAMELKNELREGYAAGSGRVEQNFAKRPFWDRLIFVAALIGGGRGTNSWLSHHSALEVGWRYLIAIAVAALLGTLASILLDKLRTIPQS
jgi:hypothetical protein